MRAKMKSVLTSTIKTNRSASNLRPRGGSAAARLGLGLSALAILALLSACSASTSTPAPTSASTATSPAVATSAPQQTGVPTPLDPCVLVPSTEASALTGASFGQGVEDTTPGGARLCNYGSSTTNVLLVEVAQDTDAAAAQNDMTGFLAFLQTKAPELAGMGITTAPVANFADGAITAQGSISQAGVTINAIDFGFVKGATFFGMSDVALGSAPPSLSAMQAEATTVLGRLP